jgi:hypothetical protein
LKVNEEKIKKIYKVFVYILLICISVQLLLINVFNIPRLQEEFLYKYTVPAVVPEDKKPIKVYSLLTQIGINYSYVYFENYSLAEFLKKFTGYFFGVLSMISLAFICGELNKGPEILSEEELKVDKMKKKIETNKEINKNNYILNGIDEIIRIISITWIYFFRNLFSIGIFFVVFFSFYFIDRRKNRCLVLYLLLPMLFLTLSFSHISNIDGLFEELDNEKSAQLEKIAIKKYEYSSWIYLSGHAFYILLMFLINSLYYYPKEEEMIKNKNTIISKHNKEIEEDQKNNHDPILPVGGSTKTLDVECSMPKNDLGNDLLYEDVDEEKNIYGKDSSSSDSDDESKQEILGEGQENKDENKPDEKVDEFNFRFVDLLAKYFFINMDKFTLIVMYLVSVPVINVAHLVLVFIFIMQIVLPKKMHYFYKIIISIFQLLILAEYLVDLLKIYYAQKFSDNKQILELFIIYSDDKDKNDIEIYIYGVVYCFCFQYRAYKNQYIASLLQNKKISLRNYIKNFLAQRNKNETQVQKIRSRKEGENNIFVMIATMINDIMERVYIWALVIGFLFFSFYFEMNFIFWVKLVLFFISLYYYIVSIQTPNKKRNDNLNITIYRVINKIIVVYCCINIFLVFLYQFLDKEFFTDEQKSKEQPTDEVIDEEKEEQKSAFILNLPNLGFTKYDKENLYYNFLPYFMTCFIFNLYKRKTKKVLKSIKNFLILRKQTNSKQLQLLKEKNKREEEKMKKIKEEQNEFIQDKMYADKYNENEREMSIKSKQIIKANLILIFTKCYWLFLFLFVGIIYSYYEISLSILIYIIIMGFFFIKMFHRIISKLRNYIKMKSYYISKVVRYAIIENPKHYQIIRHYRIITFRCILIYSFLYFILLYLYGVFDLFQQGCSKDIFKGCDPKSFSSLIPRDDEDHNTLESYIKSFSFLFGIYINMKKKNIFDVWWIHFIVSCVLISDIYNQKLEENYRKEFDILKTEMQKLANENNVLEKYSRIIDYNILIKIGLTVAGIDLDPVKDKNNHSSFRLSLQKKFMRNAKETNRIAKIVHGEEKKKISVLKNLKTIEEDESGEDSSLHLKKVKKPKKKSTQELDVSEKDLDENLPGNEFLKNKTIKQFLKVFSLCNDNEQTLSLGNGKDRVMRFVKKIFEELIIFLLICISLGKLSIWTFIYLIFTFILIATKKTMWKFYMLACFIYLTIIIQSLFFLSNISPEITERHYDDILDVLNVKLGIPWSQYLFNNKIWFFFGVGVSKSQVHLLWLEFIQIVLIFFYLDLFSYSIYQDILNLGQKDKKENFNLESLNLKPSTIDNIRQMSDIQFQQYNECLKCFEINVGNNREDFMNMLKIKKNNVSRISNFNELQKNKKKYNLEELENPVLKEMVYFRIVNKENTLGGNSTYKPLPKYLTLLQDFLYMYLHCFILILIILLSIMIGRLISIFYVTVSLYYLINCELLYLGEKYSYFTTIKKVLRIVVMIDILVQGVYQTPFVSPDKDDITLPIFDAIGFIKIITFNEETNEITISQSVLVFCKAIIYLLISIQIIIYESSRFKRYYLIYLLENKNEFKRHSIINSFKFNNQRVKIFQKSLSIRQSSDKAMEDLKKIIEELNDKLKAIGGKLYDDISKKKNYIYTTNNSIEEEELNINNDNETLEEQINNQNQQMNILNAGKQGGIIGLIKKTNEISKERNYLEVDEVKDKIKDMLYNSLITKIYLWLHKHSASYRSIDEEEKDDFDIETIKGETKIKSIIENDVNRLLSVADLEHFDKEDLKSVELLFEAHFDEKKKILLEENRLKDQRNNKARRKYSNLYNLHKSERVDINKGKKNSEDLDVLGFFKEKLAKQKEQRAQMEKEEEIKEYREKYKFIQFEELLETNLFKKYLTKVYLLQNIFYLFLSLFVHNFNSICYSVMILNHIMSASAASLFYPLSIFCYALIEYPRPPKYYWIICLYYTVFLILIKFVLQQKVIAIVLGEDTYENIISFLYHYKIGFKYHSSLFTREFLRYIIFDMLTLLAILINRNLLITDGIWYQREQEIENIYEASERIAIYQTKTYENKIDAIKDLLLQYLYSPKEILNLTKAERNRYEDNEEDFKRSYVKVRHRFPFIVNRNTDPTYNENKRGYFGRMFTKFRNEKPGQDFYSVYTGALFLICIYILVFFTQMVQDNTYGKINLDTTQFSGSMVLYLIFHVIILTIDRIIFVSQNRDNLQYEYIFYKRNEENQQGELLTEVEENELKSEISRNNKSKYKITNLPRQEIEKQLKKYNIVFIQKETFNVPLLIKYIMHLVTILVNHIIIFFYFPIKGNMNIGCGIYCPNDEQSNDFNNNYLIWIFYLLNLIYMVLSALQIKYGFYDIKRKSLFKKGQDELYSNMGSLFQNVPFLYEIKNAIDWTFTHTCLDLFQWNKFEAIYDTIFDTYCEKGEWDEKPIGERVDKKMKFGIGFTLSFGLIFTIIIPLLLFSSLNPTNKINNITEAKMSVDLTFIYENGVMKKYNLFLNDRADSISLMFKSSNDKNDTTENSSIWDAYGYSKSIETRNFKHEQVQRIIFSETSDRNWELAGPHIENLIQLLDTNKNDSDISSIKIDINYELERKLPAEAQTLKDTLSVPIYTFGSDTPENIEGAYKIGNFSEALKECKKEQINITFPNAYSPPLRVTSGTEVTALEDEANFIQKSIQLSFICSKDTEGKNNYIDSYFTFTSFNETDNTTEPIEFHIFNDQISETTQGYSVITFYVTFVLLVGSYVRDYLASDPETITLDEMPHPKKIVDLCEGIKIARYGYDFRNEEYLYTILIELMRSPDYLKILTDSSLDHFKAREKLTEDDD